MAASFPCSVIRRGIVRKDIGVPHHLKRIARKTNIILTIAFMEVGQDLSQPVHYTAAFSATQALPFDFVWFTPRAVRADTDARQVEEIRKAVKNHSQN